MNLKENQYLQAIQGFTDTLRDYVINGKRKQK